MTFNTRVFEIADYPMYSEWLSVRGRPVPCLDHLPRLGYVVFDDRNDYAVGFMFYGTKTCSVGNLASNPNANESLRSASVDYLIDYFLDKAKNEGIEMIFMNTNKERLIDRLIKRDFQIYDRNISQLGRVL